MPLKANLGDSAKLSAVIFIVFNSGDRAFVIPNAATVQAEMCATLPDEFDRVEKELVRLSERKLIVGTEVKTGLSRGMPPMPVKLC